MLKLETNLEGKQMNFGFAQKKLKTFGFQIGGNWDYDRGLFDGILHREGGETIYLRLPFKVIKGELDRRDAWIEFQKPLDKDGYIHDKSHWEEFGEEAIGDILNKL